MPGLYIHMPFCIHKCRYCDFCSYKSSLCDIPGYIDRLCSELELYCGEPADTIYFGGGTPSVVPSDELYRIINCICDKLDVCKNSEITIEVNPGTVTPEKASELKKIGFNRVSLGAQTFSDSELKILGRIHSSEEIRSSYSMLRNSGFDNISLDLMYAIPNQTVKTLSTSIDEVLNLSPEHISCYGLKFEPGTPFYDMKKKGIITQQSDDIYADMYDLIREKLHTNGYIQYELSNFSRRGRESKHNIKYWTADEYIGIGASASSYYSSARYTRTNDIDIYLKSFENIEYFKLSDADKMSEFMFLSLRLTGIGAQKNEFFKRFGKTIDSVFHGQLSKHLKNDMITELPDRYILSPKAYYISNSVLCDFV